MPKVIVLYDSQLKNIIRMVMTVPDDMKISDAAKLAKTIVEESDDDESAVVDKLYNLGFGDCTYLPIDMNTMG